MSSICLISCVKKKQSQNSPARDLYISSLFTKSRVYAERHANRWYILSAKYGLLEPDRVIAPYDLTLKDMGVREKRRWADGVLPALLERTDPRDRLIFLTGKDYHQFLIEPLRDCGDTVQLPMEGLRMGERMHWLDQQLRSRVNG